MSAQDAGRAGTTKVGVLGSCLSAITSAMLAADYRAVRLNNVAIDRSDLFVKYFIRQAPMPSRERVETLLAVKPEHAAEARPVIDRMYPAGVGVTEMPAGTRPFFDNLADTPFDLFVLDNQCDTYTLKRTFLSPTGTFDFDFSFPLQWCEQFETLRHTVQKSGRLEPAESAANWAAIVRHLQTAQPQARIVFLCAPTAHITGDPDRQARGAAFVPALRAALDGTGVAIVPPLHLPRALTKLPDDAEHFDMPVYRALAGRVFTLLLAAGRAA